MGMTTRGKRHLFFDEFVHLQTYKLVSSNYWISEFFVRCFDEKHFSKIKI